MVSSSRTVRISLRTQEKIGIDDNVHLREKMNQLLPNPITFSDLSAPPSTGLWIPDVPKLDDLGRRVTVLGYNRPAQISAYNALVGPRTLLKSPTGSGKSLIEIACAIRETVESDWRRKTKRTP